uniref:Uncharacterized protein n=1 Tax=Solanum tuberosum TaxID=4113 RepID=M1BVA2_SOLTU
MTERQRRRLPFGRDMAPQRFLESASYHKLKVELKHTPQPKKEIENRNYQFTLRRNPLLLRMMMCG